MTDPRGQNRDHDHDHDRDREAWDRLEQRLSAADFDAAPYAELPSRRQARMRIETPRNRQDPPLSSSGRRLTPRDRRRIKEHHRAKSEVLAPVTRRAHSSSEPATRGRTGWALKLGGLLCISLILITLGSERFFGVTGQGNPTATPAPTATTGTVAFVASPIQPPPTPTISEEPPTPTAEATATPTPNPRYAGRIVCLDPGHGGSDPGYTRQESEVAPAMQEAYYNLAFARAVKVRLEAHGFTVILTRTGDEGANAAGADVNGDGDVGRVATDRATAIDELQERINVCNEARADLLVSMHINGHPDDSANGYETWYSTGRPFTQQNKHFATLAFEELGEQMARDGYNATAREVNDDRTAHVDIGRDAFDSYVITGPAQEGQIVPSEMPGAIIEVLFISNDQDAAFIASNEGRNAIVTAYERAIMRFFDEIPSESPPSVTTPNRDGDQNRATEEPAT